MQGFKLKRLNIMCIMRHILYTIKIKQNSRQYTKVPYNIAQNKYLSNKRVAKRFICLVLSTATRHSHQL